MKLGDLPSAESPIWRRNDVYTPVEELHRARQVHQDMGFWGGTSSIGVIINFLRCMVPPCLILPQWFKLWSQFLKLYNSAIRLPRNHRGILLALVGFEAAGHYV